MTNALMQLAQYRMVHDDNGHEWGWVMVVVMVLLILGLAAAVFWLIRTAAASRGPVADGPAPETPMAILDRRLAAGEITPDEHRERAAILTRE